MEVIRIGTRYRVTNAVCPGAAMHFAAGDVVKPIPDKEGNLTRGAVTPELVMMQLDGPRGTAMAGLFVHPQNLTEVA